jgi:hypothetical protein
MLRQLSMASRTNGSATIEWCPEQKRKAPTGYYLGFRPPAASQFAKRKQVTFRSGRVKIQPSKLWSMAMRPTYLAFYGLLLSALLTNAQTSNQPSPEGRITGVVVNQEGQSVEHAYVCTTIYEQHGSTTGCHVYSGKNGEFELNHWPMGTLSLFAIKPEDGYSDATKRLTAKVTLSPQVPVAVVKVTLGSKAGVLTGSVIDGNTGLPVQGGTLTYVSLDASIRGCASGVNRSGYSGSGFEVTVPTAIDLIVFVSSPGYKAWFYTDVSNDSRPVLHLQSGERRSLEIELQPDQ